MAAGKGGFLSDGGRLAAIRHRGQLTMGIYTCPPPLTPAGYASYCMPMQRTERFGFFVFTMPGGVSPSGREKR